MAEFRIPQKIIHGRGAAAFLGGLEGKRMLLVTDCPEPAAAVEAHARRSGMGIRVFFVPRGAAESPTILEGTKALMEFKPDWTAALGGRGAMDCAKLMCVFYQRPEYGEADLIAGKAEGLRLTKTKLVAIPLLNTDGGESMGRAALLHGPSETVINCPGLLPKYTLLDDLLLPGCPEEEDSHAVLSTLTLALEAAVSPASSPFTQPLALESLRLVIQSVMAYYGVSSKRDDLLLAQCLAGISHFNSGPGLCSAMIRSSAVFGLKHSFGQGAAIYLPAILRSLPGQSGLYDSIANVIGLKRSKGAAALAAIAEEYADMLGLSLTLEEMGLEKNDFLKRLTYASRHAAQGENVTAILGEDAQKQIEELYRSCYS